MRPNATTLLAFVLGAAIAGGGTASAAKLITGADIKNGSITVKDLSPGLRAKLGEAGPTGAKGDPGQKGDTGAKGDKGEPGLNLITFGDSYVPSGRPLSNPDVVVTQTAEQLSDAGGGGAGGPITVPAYSKVVIHFTIAVTTLGSGSYTCALQLARNGGDYYDMKRPPAANTPELRFETEMASWTTPTPISLQFRVVCNGSASRLVQDATLTVLGGAVPNP